MTGEEAARSRLLARVREQAAAEPAEGPVVERLAALLAQIRLDQAGQDGAPANGQAAGEGRS